MPIHPNQPPPLPSQVTAKSVTRIDGTKTQAVTVTDAARLLGLALKTMQGHINEGRVDVAVAGDGTTYVLIDSLWLLVPEEDRRAGLQS